MSNFTTFFPSAGGGGGEGSGINAYAPFKVGTTDNNPQGYIHSTGVYTNPVDESVWLKTGKLVADASSVYPNAYSEIDYRLTSGTDDKDVDFRSSMAFNGTTAYVVKSSTNAVFRLEQVTESTRAWGSSINKDSSLVSGSYGAIAIGYDSTANNWISADYASGVNVINKWNAAFTSITSTFSTYTQTTNRQIRNIAVDTVNNNLLLTANNQNVYVYNLSNNAYIGVYSLSTRMSASQPSGTACHPTTGNLWVVDGTVVKELNVSTGVATGTSFDLYPNTYLTAGLVRGIAWKDADTLLAITQKSATALDFVLSGYEKDGIRVVGDSTARTDSSGSTQPLFIKLK